MNQPAFDFRHRLAYPIFANIANALDPVCKKTFWNFQRKDDGEPQYIDTAFGTRQVMGKLSGIGRVADVFVQGRDQLDVTFSHHKFASLFSYRTVEHQWISLPDGQGASPFITAPSEQMMHEYIQNSFSILLLPQIENRQQVAVAVSKIRRGQLLRYEIIATDPDAREGVAIRLEKV